MYFCTELNRRNQIVQICTLDIGSESALHLRCTPEASVDGTPKSVCTEKIRNPILTEQHMFHPEWKWLHTSRYIISLTPTFVSFLPSNSKSTFEIGCAEGSSSNLESPLKYGSAKAWTRLQWYKLYARALMRNNMFCPKEYTSSAVGRSLGSNASKRSSKRRARGSALWNLWEKGIGRFLGMASKYSLALSLRIWMLQKIWRSSSEYWCPNTKCQ